MPKLQCFISDELSHALRAMRYARSESHSGLQPEIANELTKMAQAGASAETLNAYVREHHTQSKPTMDSVVSDVLRAGLVALGKMPAEGKPAVPADPYAGMNPQQRFAARCRESLARTAAKSAPGTKPKKHDHPKE